MRFQVNSVRASPSRRFLAVDRDYLIPFLLIEKGDLLRNLIARSELGSGAHLFPIGAAWKRDFSICDLGADEVGQSLRVGHGVVPGITEDLRLLGIRHRRPGIHAMGP